MRNYKKKDFPVADVRRFLEPGPVVLVSSAWKSENDIMTMGWHMIMGLEPSLVGCYIWNENHSFELIKKSKECVINIPTVEIASTVVKIGNCSGEKVDKFEQFNLTPISGDKVKAPMIQECYANFECKLVDSSQITKYNLFIFEVQKAHVAASPRFPETIHYRGEGLFMVSGPTTKKYHRYFKPEYLES